MLVHKEKSNCCGCTACMTVCPTKAITMVTDEEGFLYPQIDEKKCIHCNLCRRTCNFVRKHDWKSMMQPEVYAIKHRSLKVRAASQSGGMFTALSDAVIDMGGTVYGAGYDSNCKVIHKRATNKEERDKLRGSKYVQSDMQDIFKKVIEDLLLKKYVLFSGTPCQCAGLKSLLEMKKINTEKLFLVDLVCHGVPSPKVYNAFKKFMEEKHHGKVEGFNFRNKKFGWRDTVESTWINGHEYDTQLYCSLFYRDNILREACYQCPYKSVNQLSDITIGDFWGIEKSIPELDDGKGVSLVLIHSEKGKKLFSSIKKNLIVKESNVHDCLQPSLEQPMSKPSIRNKFWIDFKHKSFEYILTHYTNEYGWKNHVKKAMNTIRIPVIKCAKIVLPRGVINVLKSFR